MKLLITLAIIASGSYLLLDKMLTSQLQPLANNIHQHAAEKAVPASQNKTGPKCTYTIESDYLGREWIVVDTSGDKADRDRCLLYQRQRCLEHEGCRLRKNLQADLQQQ